MIHLSNQIIRRVFSVIMVIAVLVGLTVSTSTPPALAETQDVPGVTHYVTSAADSGPGTLRSLVAAAAPGDIIAFALPLGTTIELKTGQLLVNKNLEIRGPGPNLLYISGYMTSTVQLHDRVFYIANGVNVKISGLGVINGWETNDFGGGIRNDGKLTLEKVLLGGNRACGLGGALFNGPQGELFYNGGTITQNSVPLDLENCYAVYGGSGGGIANEGVMTVKNVQIFNNYAVMYGGGIYSHRYSQTNLKSVNVHHNIVTGLYPDEVTLWVWGQGGGFYNGGTANVAESKFEYNIVNGMVGTGGGIANQQNGIMTIHKSIVAYNEVPGVGAGIYNEGCPDHSCNGILTMHHSDIHDNYSHNSDHPGNFKDGVGAGLRNSGGYVDISYSTFRNNIADDAGGGLDSIAGGVTISNSTISGNTSYGVGGGISSYSHLDILNTTIANNYAEEKAGGLFVAYDDPYDVIGMQNTIIGGNTAPQSADCFVDPLQVINSRGGNLVQDDTGCIMVGNTAADLFNVDPLLGILKDNGGPTLTHAIATDSPAVDAAVDAGCPADDQRGAPRPADGDLDGTPICDIGAFEGIPGGVPGNWAPFANPLYVETPMNTPVSFTLTGADPEEDYPLTFSLVSEPMNGTLSGTLPNLTYTPNPGFGEEDYFYFKVTDTKGGESIAKVTIWVIPIYANLHITKVESDDPALIGTTLTYTLTVTNDGPESAKDVVITDTLPAGLEFESASGCSYAAGVVTCTIPMLYHHESVVFEINAKITDAAPGTIINLATVSSIWVVDKNLADNESLVDTTIVAEYCVYNNGFEVNAGTGWSKTTISSTPIGARKFLGEFNNETVTLTLPDVLRHNTIKFSFDFFAIRSWDGNTIFNDVPTGPMTLVGPDYFTLGLDGETLLYTTFTNWDSLNYRQAFPFHVPNSFPARFLAAENNTLGYGYEDNPVMDSVYKLSYHLIHNADDVQLSFMADGLQEIGDESWGLDNVKVCFTGDATPLYRHIFVPIVSR